MQLSREDGGRGRVKSGTGDRNRPKSAEIWYIDAPDSHHA